MKLPCITDYLKEVLPSIDEYLLEQKVGLLERPIQAALIFSRDCIMEIKIDGKRIRPDFEDSDFLLEPWFAGIYQLIEKWYRTRYGEAMKPAGRRKATGFVVIWGAAFSVEVPLSAVSPGQPGETMWLSFPQAIQESEQSLGWVLKPPNFSSMSADDLKTVTRNVKRVASLLRSINVCLLGIGPVDSISHGFIVSLRVHLDAVAEQVVKNWERGGTSKAAWELQIACECALKLLSSIKTGQFRKTHDLFVLYDIGAEFMSVNKRARLKELPRQEEMALLRYGQAEPPPLGKIFKMYLATLEVVKASLDPLVTLDLKTASFEVGRAPWKRPLKRSESEDADQS